MTILKRTFNRICRIAAYCECRMFAYRGAEGLPPPIIVQGTLSCTP